MRNKFKIYIILFSIIISVQLSACNTNPDGSYSLQPNSMNLKPPSGPPEYEQGWTDGCNSGSNAYTTPFYKQIKAFDFKMDMRLRKNKMYYQVWKDAFVYCSIYWERVNSGVL